MKKRLLSILVCLTLCLSMLSTAALAAEPFSDIKAEDWYYDAAMYVNENGLMTGYGIDRFAPEVSITRGQIVTILHRMEGAPAVNYLMEFRDVPAQTWYTEAVRWAASTGITSGTGDGSTFSPDEPITREQLATMLWRYAQFKSMDVSVGDDTNILSYEDAFTIGEYAIAAMQWVCGAGIMRGSGAQLTPKATASRAQTAQIIMNFLEK